MSSATPHLSATLADRLHAKSRSAKPTGFFRVEKFWRSPKPIWKSEMPIDSIKSYHTTWATMKSYLIFGLLSQDDLDVDASDIDAICCRPPSRKFDARIY